jgi:hypothetical protein
MRVGISIIIPFYAVFDLQGLEPVRCITMPLSKGHSPLH